MRGGATGCRLEGEGEGEVLLVSDENVGAPKPII